MHAEIDYCGNTSAPLTGALLIYGNGEFLMQCRADGDELCDARAITDAELMELINSIKPVQRRWIEPPLLLDSGQELIWWTPAQQRTLYFESSDAFLNERGHQAYPQPALLWRWRPNTLDLWALNSSKRPTLSSKLFRAPYFNLSGSRVCLGTSQMPSDFAASNCRAVESAFFDSSFTHTVETPLNGWGGSHGEFWASLEGQTKFPTKHLVPTGITVADALALISKEIP
jgi:PRTRC genetic system protein B